MFTENITCDHLLHPLAKHSGEQLGGFLFDVCHLGGQAHFRADWCKDSGPWSRERTFGALAVSRCSKGWYSF